MIAIDDVLDFSFKFRFSSGFKFILVGVWVVFGGNLGRVLSGSSRGGRELTLCFGINDSCLVLVICFFLLNPGRYSSRGQFVGLHLEALE